MEFKLQFVTGEPFQRNDGAWYAGVLQGLRDNSGCISAHLCGTYLRNRARNRGLRDARERPYEENIALTTQANREMAAWVQAARTAR